MSGVRRSLLYALLTGGCFAAGWTYHVLKSGGAGEGMMAQGPVAAPQGISPEPWEAPDSAWPAVWKATDSMAERELLLEAWREKNPQRLLHFLRGLPPLTLPDQRRLEEEALMAWGAAEPVPAFEFACRHHGEYQAADRLLREWLERDLDTGLKLLTHHLLPASIKPGGPGELSWVLKDPARVCARLVTMRNTLPPVEKTGQLWVGTQVGLRPDDQRRAFIRAAFQEWARSDPTASMGFIPSLRGADASAALNGVCGTLPIPEAARLLETFPRPGAVELAAPELVKRWAESDFPAALKWCVENLPPAAGDGCLVRLGIELRNGLPVEDAALRQSLGDFPWWAWQRIIRQVWIYENPDLPLRLMPLAPNDEILRNLAKPLRDLNYADELLTRVPPEVAERVRQLLSTDP